MIYFMYDNWQLLKCQLIITEFVGNIVLYVMFDVDIDFPTCLSKLLSNFCLLILNSGSVWAFFDNNRPTIWSSLFAQAIAKAVDKSSLAPCL